MRNTAGKPTLIILTFNVTFIDKSYGNTKRRFKARPKPKVNVQLHWISRYSMFSWIKNYWFIYSGLSYKLDVNGKNKKANGNWNINKHEHSTFRTGKPGNFNSLREVI